MEESRADAAAALALSLLLLVGCPPGPTSEPVLQADPPAAAPEIHALLINGGDRRQINYWSHLQHLRELRGVLRAAGVDDSRITVFSSDGEDPAEDLARRDVAAEPDFWLLPKSGLGNLLRPPLIYVDSRIDGVSLRPATREALAGWFRAEGAKLGNGETLLFYVTDHGNKNGDDLANNTISLWGEKLSVHDLHELLAGLDPGVRVVLVMSQCFSGSFAHEIFRDGRDGVPPGNVCGYFATTADRRAHGCYPESFRESGEGYSFRLFEALNRTGDLAAAQRQVLVSDRTPDVPHKSSDFYLQRVLARAAAEAGRDEEAFVDELLAAAWRDPSAREDGIRLLDHLAFAFGLFSPRSLDELDRHSAGLPELAERLETYAKRWRDALEALKKENLERFLVAHPEWRPRLRGEAIRALDDRERTDTTAELLRELVDFTEDDGENYERLRSLRRRARDAGEASDRTEVRLAAVLRMRNLLYRFAGQHYLEQGAPAAERTAARALAACEDLPLADEPERSDAALAVTDPFPPLAEDQQLIASVTPGWMGIRYRPASGLLRERYDLPRGAAVVSHVFAGGPAEEAGLRSGDFLVGPPGAPFTEPHSVREWIMLQEVDSEASLELLRDGRVQEVRLRPRTHPLELPKLPGPPRVGSPAPTLDLEFVRGGRHLESAEPRLLFFWASWCGRCKQALPEVLAFGLARGVEVVAITDEHPDEVEAFLEDYPGVFPRIVARDPGRVGFARYGVSGTPTFALVDAEGILRHYQTGYRIHQGITAEGWQWSP